MLPLEVAGSFQQSAVHCKYPLPFLLMGVYIFMVMIDDSLRSFTMLDLKEGKSKQLSG